MKRWAALLLILASPARAGERPLVTIEKATVPWGELERLLRSEGRTPPPLKREAPSAFSSTLQVSGEVGEGRARLSISADVFVLVDRWLAVPLLPPALAISSVSVKGPRGLRGLLVRSGDGVYLAAEGAGDYHLEIEVEGPLEQVGQSQRLLLAPPGLSGGRAQLTVRGGEHVSGRTAWRTSPAAGGSVRVEAALGEAGLELLVDRSERPTEAGITLEELRALTVVSLGGTGVTRLTLRAASDDGSVNLELPPNAQPWKAFVGGVAQRITPGARQLRLPLRRRETVEVAYTFETTRMGIRGRYRVELPRLEAPVRDARWEVWLPEGLVYTEAQSSLTSASCGLPGPATRTPLEEQGICTGFARAVLEPGLTYVEGAYRQPL